MGTMTVASQGREQAGRRTALLDAALRLIASEGLAAVSHRSVERLAGAPHGSTTYYFQSKAALIAAARQRLADLDHLALDGLALQVARALASRSPAPQWAAITSALARWVDEHRDLHLARFELALQAARDPALAEADAAWHETFLDVIEPVVTSAGARSPRTDTRFVCAAFMGVVFDQAVRPQPDFAATTLPRALQRLLLSVTATQ
jgi:DNA-binding transcriptional regulator YbjK